MVVALAALLGIGALASEGCSGVTDSGTPLTLQMTPDRTAAAPGQSVGFQVEATGLALAGLIVAYGDGAADTVPTSGASRAKATFSHAFQQEGSYLVHAAAYDAFRADSATDEVTIDVQSAPAAERALARGLTSGGDPHILLPSHSQP